MNSLIEEDCDDAFWEVAAAQCDNFCNQAHRPADPVNDQSRVSHEEPNSQLRQTGTQKKLPSLWNRHFKYDVKLANGDPCQYWVYPVDPSRPLREYQRDITQTALFWNTLVCLPTGLGKTLIAAVVMYNFHRWFPEGKVIFMAPTKPLVYQQIEACYHITGIPQEITTDMTGQMKAAIRAQQWKTKRVFYVTPQTLERDIASGACPMESVVCMVVDEAHRSTGAYAYVRCAQKLMAANIEFRILALSATPGSSRDAIQEVIDNLQIQKLEFRNEDDAEVQKHVHDRCIELIKVPPGEGLVKVEKAFQEVMRPIINSLCDKGLLYNRDVASMSSFEILSARERYHAAPPEGFQNERSFVERQFSASITLCSLYKLMLSHGIPAAYRSLQDKLNEYPLRMLKNSDCLQQLLRGMQEYIGKSATTPKLEKVKEVILDHFEQHDHQSTRVLIFTQFRESVQDIMTTLTKHCHIIKPMPFVGQTSGKRIKGQTQKVQQAVLKEFRAGDYNVLVATSIGEEGLDIGEVDLVICFDANISPLRMIQRMGRTGRKRKGRVVILATDGEEHKGYLRKKSKANQLGKLLQDGGRNTFEFHQSPPMVPKDIFNNIHYVKLVIPEWVPKNVKAKPVAASGKSDPGSDPLTAEEQEVLMRHPFILEDRPLSLISFPRFQRTLCPVYRVKHSRRTRRMFVNVMRRLNEPFSVATGSLKNASEQVEPDSENDDEPFSPIRQPKFSSSKRRWSEATDTQHWDEESWGEDVDGEASLSWMKSQRKKKRNKGKAPCVSLSGSIESGFVWASELKDTPSSDGSHRKPLPNRRPLRSKSMLMAGDDKENRVSRQSSLSTRSSSDDAIDALLSPIIPCSTPRARGSAKQGVTASITPRCNTKKLGAMTAEVKAPSSSPRVLGNITNNAQMRVPPIKRRLGLSKRPVPMPCPQAQRPASATPSENCVEKINSPPRKEEHRSPPVEEVPDTPEQETGPCSAPVVSSPLKKTNNSACREILSNSARHIGPAIRAAALAVRPLSLPFKAPGRVAEARLAYKNFIRSPPARMPSFVIEAGEKDAARLIPPPPNGPKETPCFPSGSCGDEGESRAGAPAVPSGAEDALKACILPTSPGIGTTPHRILSLRTGSGGSEPSPGNVPAMSAASDQGTTDSDFVGPRRKGMVTGTGEKSISEEWQPPSQEDVAPPSVRQPKKRKRLRKIGLGKDADSIEPGHPPPRRKEHPGRPEKKSRPGVKANTDDGRRGVGHFLEEEAEVSEDMNVSEDEDDGKANSVDDSFIDDRTQVSASLSASDELRTQDTLSPVNMMDIYRRSLLSQLPPEDGGNMPRFSSPPRQFANPNKMKLQYSRRDVQDTPSSEADDTRSEDNSEDVETWTETEPSATATPCLGKGHTSPFSDFESPLYPRSRGPCLGNKGPEGMEDCGGMGSAVKGGSRSRDILLCMNVSNHTEQVNRPVAQASGQCRSDGLASLQTLRPCQVRAEPPSKGPWAMGPEGANPSGPSLWQGLTSFDRKEESLKADGARLGAKADARPWGKPPPCNVNNELLRRGWTSAELGEAGNRFNSGEKIGSEVQTLGAKSLGLAMGLDNVTPGVGLTERKISFGEKGGHFLDDTAKGRPEGDSICDVGEGRHHLGVSGVDMLTEDDDWLSNVDLDALEEEAMRSRSMPATTSNVQSVIPKRPDGWVPRPEIRQVLQENNIPSDASYTRLPLPHHPLHAQSRVAQKQQTRPEAPVFPFTSGHDSPILDDGDEDKWDCSPSFDLGIQF